MSARYNRNASRTREIPAAVMPRRVGYCRLARKPLDFIGEIVEYVSAGSDSLRRRARSLCAGLTVLLLCGCGPQAMIKTEKTKPVTLDGRKVFAVLSAAQELTPEHKQQFRKSFPAMLTACGIENRLQIVNPKMEKPDTVKGAMLAYGPDAVLTIISKYSTIMTVRRGSSTGPVVRSSEIGVKFEASLLDVTEKATPWKATVDLHLNQDAMFNYDAGNVLAKAIVEHMQEDGIVPTSCSKTADAKP